MTKEQIFETFGDDLETVIQQNCVKVTTQTDIKDYIVEKYSESECNTPADAFAEGFLAGMTKAITLITNGKLIIQKTERY